MLNPSNVILSIGLASTLISASPVNLKLNSRDAAIRDSPSGDYAPSSAVCPANLAVRIPVKGSLDPKEAAYIDAKTKNSVDDWTAYLTNVGLADFDVASFVPTRANAQVGTLPNIGVAVSGGGTRAMLVGGGMLAAFDGRNATAVAAKTGGVLQLAQSLCGLSGGSWMTGSYMLNNGPTFESLRDEVWNLQGRLFGPETKFPFLYEDAVGSTAEKAAAGYPVSVVDPYGRLISYHLINDSSNARPTKGVGSETLWSSIADTPSFKAQTAPFPIIITIGRQVGETNITIASPIFEVTPFEFGVNYPSLSAFIPITSLGTNFSKGVPVDPLVCAEGFENAGWLMGCSGNIFGALVQTGGQTLNVPAITENATFAKVIGTSPDNEVDTGRVANPFFGIAPTTNPASEDSLLYLVDAGLGSENVPFYPLIQPQRKIDVIIAVDASADTNNFPDGQEIFHTYEKSLQPGYGPFAPFPVIPNPVDFVALGLNSRPVIFGSSCGNATHPAATTETPTILYLPNYNINFATNTSTGTDTYSTQSQQSFFDNSFAIVTQSGSIPWSKCVACVLVDAQVDRNGGTRTSECSACFDKYCHVTAP